MTDGPLLQSLANVGLEFTSGRLVGWLLPHYAFFLYWAVCCGFVSLFVCLPLCFRGREKTDIWEIVFLSIKLHRSI